MDLDQAREHAWHSILVNDHNLSDDDAAAALQRYVEEYDALPEPASTPGSFDVLDKDLFAVVLRRGSKDRLGLWDLQGTRKWEIQVDLALSEPEYVSAVAWSPDGKHILVAHQPPRFTMHDIHDGATLQSIISVTSGPEAEIVQLSWFCNDTPSEEIPFPDLLRRLNKPPGSAFSVLAMLPTLDKLPTQPSGQSLDNKDDLAGEWPTLLPFHHFPQALDIRTADTERSKDAPAPMSLRDNIAFAVDKAGRVHVFLAGTYYLGLVQTDFKFSPSIFKVPDTPVVLLHKEMPVQSQCVSDIIPSTLYFPMLVQEDIHRIAQISSSLRDLLGYCSSVLETMHQAWFLGDSPRTMGKLWLVALENIQTTDRGYSEGRGILELYTLLAVGHPSQALAAALSGGENMSDRKLTKWENSVSEALSKIITYAERRLHPACQRAHLLLEELIAIFRMQEVLPPNHLSEVSKEKVDSATSLLRKVSLLLYLGTGLAMKAREELGRFKEFVMWLRHETQRAQNSANEAQGTPVFKHDPSDVTRYLESGLVVSEVDRWFEGDEPGDEVLTTFMNPISCPGLLLKTLDRVENLLQGGEDSPSVPFDRKAEDKNMLALVQTLTQGCSHLFQDVSHSVTASTQITAPPLPGTLATHDDTDVVRTERTIWNADENAFIEFVALYFPGNPRHLGILRCQYQLSELQPRPVSYEIAIYVCVAPFMDPHVHAYDILDFEFLDDEVLVAVVRHSMRDTRLGVCPFLALIAYSDDVLQYDALVAEPGEVLTREDAIHQVSARLKASAGDVKEVPVTRMHELSSLSRTGKVSLVLNGKRRVGCVMDDRARVEVLDLDTEGTDMLGGSDVEMEE